MVAWDARSTGPWTQELEGAYAVINLAGEPVNQRWNSAARERILRSRIDSVEAICKGIQETKTPPQRWINASAIGFYGNRGDGEVDERSPSGDGFLAEVCIAWEEAVRRCVCPSTTRTVLRLGMVLGHGGALVPLAKLARIGLGGAAGTGEQVVSWIHIDDLVGIVTWLLDSGQPPDVINVTSPRPVTNAELMRRIRQVVHAPFGLPAPAFGVRLLGKTLGPDADLILNGVRALPRVALQLGYPFHFPDLQDALEDLLV